MPVSNEDLARWEAAVIDATSRESTWVCRCPECGGEFLPVSHPEDTMCPECLHDGLGEPERSVTVPSSDVLASFAGMAAVALPALIAEVRRLRSPERLLPERRREIAARVAAATSGPWASGWDDEESVNNDEWPLIRSGSESVVAGMWYDGPRGACTREDADLIAHAPQDLADLLADADACDVLIAKQVLEISSLQDVIRHSNEDS